MFEVHAVYTGHQHRWDPRHRSHSQHLHYVVLFYIDEAKRRVEQKLELVIQVRIKVLEGSDVTAKRAEPWDKVLRQPFGPLLRHIGHYPAGAKLTVTDMRDHIAMPTNRG